MLKRVKKEFFHIRKAFFVYKKGFSYFKSRYFLARKIFDTSKALERPVTHHDLSIHFLTSHYDFIMLAWALASFYQSSEIIGEVFIHSDGTLKKSDIAKLKKIFPSIKIINSNIFTREYSAQLEAYPILKKFRIKYNNFSFKKIIDPYFVSSKKFHLILDSDILWFGSPTDIKQVVDGEIDKTFMQSNNSAIEVTFKDGSKLDQKLQYANAGIILYSKNNFDVAKFSEFLDKLDESKSKNLHFADQAGHAYCLKKLELLPEASYIIKGDLGDNVIAKHYTGPRRAQFYFEGLQILKDKIF